MSGILIRERRGRFGTQSRRGEGHVKIEAEVGVTLLLAEECLEPPEAGRDKEGVTLPESLEKERGLADTVILNF